MKANSVTIFFLWITTKSNKIQYARHPHSALEWKNKTMTLCVQLPQRLKSTIFEKNFFTPVPLSRSYT